MDGPTPRRTVDGLIGTEGGKWNVVTRDSTHLIDLDNGVVTRVPGLDARPSINDQARRLRSFDLCRFGRRGHWTMFTDGWSDEIDFFWHDTSVIVRTELLSPGDSV